MAATLHPSDDSEEVERVRKYLVGLVALVLLTTVCGDDGAATTGGSDTTVVTIQQAQPATVTGTALPRFPDGPDPAVGMMMPEVEGASFDGTPVTISNDGRPKVLLFLAHW